MRAGRSGPCDMDCTPTVRYVIAITVSDGALDYLPLDTQRSPAGPAEFKGENVRSRHPGAPAACSAPTKRRHLVAHPQILTNLLSGSNKTDNFLPNLKLCSIFVLHRPNGERPLSESDEPAQPKVRRDRSPAVRRSARQRKAEREMGIVGLLSRGVSIAEIADREGVSERGMRKYVRSVLARRAPQPPEEFLALQVSRLNEALLVAYSAMSGANLQAVDRVVKNRARTRPLSRLRRRRRGPGAESGPPRAALPGPARARSAARPRGTEWRRKRLRLLDSRAETARPGDPALSSLR